MVDALLRRPAEATADGSVIARDGGVSIAKLQNARHDASRCRLLVAPSAFIAPHLYVADVPGHPLLLIHPVEATPAAPPVAELVRRLETVANRGRLEIARAIVTEPRTAGSTLITTSCSTTSRPSRTSRSPLGRWATSVSRSMTWWPMS
jgi:hypothetical protein